MNQNASSTSSVNTAPATAGASSSFSSSVPGTTTMNTNSSQNTAATTESACTAAPRRSVAKRLKDTVYKLRVAGGRTLTYVFRPRRRLSALLMTLLGSLMATISSYAQTLSANALPQGGNVANGAAAITTHGAAMKVTQTTQDLVVNWNSFNIGSGASVPP